MQSKQYLCEKFRAIIDINKQDRRGNTAFMLAAKNNANEQVIQYLCDTFKDTIDINKKNNDGDTALVLARKHSNSEVFKYLSTL